MMDAAAVEIVTPYPQLDGSVRLVREPGRRMEHHEAACRCCLCETARGVDVWAKAAK